MPQPYTTINRALRDRVAAFCDAPHLQIAQALVTLGSTLNQDRVVERAKLFFLRNFERFLVLLLVASLLLINYLIEQKFAFLSFYYKRYERDLRASGLHPLYERRQPAATGF